MYLCIYVTIYLSIHPSNHLSIYVSLTLYSSWRYHSKVFVVFTAIFLFALTHESALQDDALRSALKSCEELGGGRNRGGTPELLLPSPEHPPEANIYGKYSLLMALLQETLNGSDVEYLQPYLSC